MAPDLCALKGWPREARQIKTAPVGTQLTLPEPPGEPWMFTVTVRSGGVVVSRPGSDAGCGCGDLKAVTT